MAKSSETAVVPIILEYRIHVIRGVRVMLDADLAELYGVATKSLNQAVQRNLERFPVDFAFQLTAQEFASLRSQTVTSKTGRGGRTYLPWAFTEHGVAMLSGVLRSETAVRVNIEIIRAFVRMRQLLLTPGEIVSRLGELADAVRLHDDQLKLITDVLAEMLEPPPEPPTPGRIGFRPPEPSPE